MQSNGPAGKEADQHFAALEEQFIGKATEMGYEYTDIKDFIEDRGVPENDLNILVAGLRNPSRYNNALFKGNSNQQPKYDFADPMIDPSRNINVGMGMQGMYQNQFQSAP